MRLLEAGTVLPDFDQVVARACDEMHVGCEPARRDGLVVKPGQEYEQVAGLPAPDKNIKTAASKAAISLLVCKEAADPCAPCAAVLPLEFETLPLGFLHSPLLPDEDLVLVETISCPKA